MNWRAWAVGTAWWMGLALPAQAALKIDSQGQLGVETRAFQEDNNELTQDYGVATVGRLELDARLKPFRVNLRGFVRYDELDRDRSAAFPEEAWIEFKKNPVRIRVGYQMLTWTATEAFHPADVINSRYLDSNVENQEKIGEPMAMVQLKFLEGTVEGYVMPFFTSPIFPSAQSRQNFAPPGVQIGKPLWLTRDDTFAHDGYGFQWAARVRQTIGRADITLHTMQMQDRYQPTIVINPNNFRPRPLYQPVTQFGATYQQALGAFVLKFEGAHRIFYRPESGATRYGPIPDKDNTQAAVGIEYGWSHDSGAESTILLEGQSLFGSENASQLVLFQRDALVGYRLALNDIASTEFLVSTIVDLEREEEVLFNASYKRRLGETWNITAGLRIIHAPPKQPQPVGLELLDDANQLHFSLIRYF